MIKKTLAIVTLTLCGFSSIAQAVTCRHRYQSCMQGGASGLVGPNCEVYTPKGEGPGASRGYNVCNSTYIKLKNTKTEDERKEKACMAGCVANMHSDKACEGQCGTGRR